MAAALEKERRDAVTYTILTVLCTPAFVALASLLVVVLLCEIFRHGDYDLDALGVYTGMAVFLASMIVFVLANSTDSLARFELNGMWLAAVAVFVVLLVLTFGTPVQERSPVFFAVVYAALGFMVLGFLGQVQLPYPRADDADPQRSLRAVVYAAASFIVAAYGEIFRNSWLWVPPKPFEVRVGARVLCRLIDAPTDPLHPSAVAGRVATLLGKLKLVQTTDGGLLISPKGLDFVRTATQGPSQA